MQSSKVSRVESHVDGQVPSISAAEILSEVCGICCWPMAWAFVLSDAVCTKGLAEGQRSRPKVPIEFQLATPSQPEFMVCKCITLWQSVCRFSWLFQISRQMMIPFDVLLKNLDAEGTEKSHTPAGFLTAGSLRIGLRSQQWPRQTPAGHARGKWLTDEVLASSNDLSPISLGTD